MTVSVVLGVIIALLVVAIISLSIAIHRLRQALQQQKSTSGHAGPYSIHFFKSSSGSKVLKGGQALMAPVLRGSGVGLVDFFIHNWLFGAL